MNGSFGYGSMHCRFCDNRYGAPSGGLSFGGTLSPRLLLAGATAFWTRSDGRVRRSAGIVDFRLRYYPSLTGGFFLTGGLGVGGLRASFDDITVSESGVAALLGLGYDVPIGTNVSLTPFLNGFGFRTRDGGVDVLQAGLGITVH